MHLPRPALLGLLLAALGLHAQAADKSDKTAIEAGKRIAQQGSSSGAAACMSCHGAKGEGAGAFPPLAGQHPGYLKRQLDHLASGTRQNPIMAPMAQALSDTKRTQVAAYYASLPLGIRPKQGPLPQARDGNGAWLAERGRWADGIAACSKCHGPGGVGVGQGFPAIGQLGASYMQDQIKAWQDGTRDAGPLGLMQSIAQKLTPQDVQDVAEYYQRLHQKTQP